MTEKLCVLGIGDCATTNEKTTELFNQQVTENIRNTLINISSTNSGVMSAAQTISIRGVKCGQDFNLNNVSQVFISKVNFANLSEVMTEEKLSSMLKSAITQATETDQNINKAFMSGASSNTDATVIKNINIQKFVSNYTLNDFRANIASVEAAQLSEIVGIEAGRDCNMNDISQTIEMDIIAKNIGSTMTKHFANLVNDSSIDQDSKTGQDNKGGGPLDFLGDLFSGWAMFIIAVIAAVLLAVFLGPLVVKKILRATS